MVSGICNIFYSIFIYKSYSVHDSYLILLLHLAVYFYGFYLPLIVDGVVMPKYRNLKLKCEYMR